MTKHMGEIGVRSREEENHGVKEGSLSSFCMGIHTCSTRVLGDSESSPLNKDAAAHEDCLQKHNTCILPAPGRVVFHGGAMT